MNRLDVDVLIFEGGPVVGPPLGWLDELREAVVMDHIERSLEAGAKRVLVATDRPRLRKAAGQSGALTYDTTMPERPFHFGEALAAICRSLGSHRVICLGGGSAPLMPAAEWRHLMELLVSGNDIVISNSVYSSDIIAFAPASALFHAQLMPLDNQMAWTLREAGLRFLQMPSTAGSIFDLDTPTDALVMALHPARGRHAQGFLERLELPLDRVKEVIGVLGRPEGEVFLYGRAAGAVLQALEKGTRCRVRSFVEERGMRSLGREKSGAYSLLAAVIDEVGPAWYFDQLSRVCNAALLDTRVLFAHRGREVEAMDRFLSDLGWAGDIRDDYVREFTLAAADARIPVLLGGHSLVNGGLRILLSLAGGDAGFDSQG